MAVNYSDLEIEVSIDGEVSGEVQEGGSGGTTNYNRLTHKPQINDVELIGNKSLEDLGIVNNVQPDWEQADDTQGDYIKNKPENIVTDADYVHTDNNFTDDDKEAIGNIPSVSANPFSTSETLTGIEINGVGYAVTGGSGSVNDVKVDNVSVVNGEGIANIDLSGYAKNTDIPTVNNSTITIQKNSQNVDSFTLNQGENKSINISVPTKTSDISNDSGFITNTVNNLANYYLKSETYTKTEVGNLIDAAVNGRFEKVQTLPVTGEPNVIYLVPKTQSETNNSYDEYIWQDNAWELLGSTEIDLSGYVTDDDLTTALQSYLTTSAFNTAIANYYTKTEVGNLLDNKVDKVSGKGLSTYDYDATAKRIVDSVTSNLANKVDKVQGKGLSTNDYDNTAKNIVDGVTSALANKVDKVNGKGLSTEDYTTTEKTKLSGISNNATKTASSATNGHIEIDDVDTTVYDDTDIKTALSDTTTEVEGNPISFSTLSAQNATECLIDLDPIQDLHGYDKPWVGGAGKNLLGFTESDISSLNNITISNHHATIYGAGFDFEVDGNGYINKITFDGVAPSSTVTLKIKAMTDYVDKNIIINGSPSNGGDNAYFQAYLYDGTNVVGSYRGQDSVSFTPNNLTNSSVFRIIIKSGVTYSGKYIFNLMIRLSSISDRTFAPYENICPISGRTEANLEGCGKNLCDNNSQIHLTVSNTVNTDGTFSSIAQSDLYYYETSKVNKLVISTTFSKLQSSVVRVAYSNEIPSAFTTERRVANISDSTAITVDKTYRYVSFMFYWSDSSNKADIQIEVGQTATTYEPYTESNDLNIAFGETVYGCHIDVKRGVLRVTDAIVDLGDLSWGYNPTRTRFEASVDGRKYDENRNRMTLPNYTFYNGSPNDLPNKTYTCSNNNTSLYIKDLDYGSDYSAFKTAMIGCIAVYNLATPTEIPLTPHAVNLLKGANYISTDGDKITLTYRTGEVATLGDVKKAVDDMSAKMHVYSTEEQVVATWIDGKPVYEKSYLYENSSGSTYGSDITIDDNFGTDKQCVPGGLQGMFYATSGANYSVPWTDIGPSGNNGTSTGLFISGDGKIKLRIRNDTYGNNYKLRVTARYTKTTDT